MKDFFEKINQALNHVKEKRFVKGLSITTHVFWNILLISTVLFVMLLLFIGGAGAGYFMSLVEDQKAYGKEEFEEQIYNYEEVSNIYFSDEKYLGEIPADLERKERSLDDISEHLIHAIISTEDEYFFEHKGIVPKALLRATYQEVAGTSVQSGGSTLTQQIIKNQVLTNEVSFERKAKEIALALRMENYFDKDEILEAYLNIVPFGRNADGRNIAGAASAAEGIFGVEVSELNIAQAAFIAGLPKNPFTYTPFTNGGDVKENFDAGLARMKYVLDNMFENQFITEKEYKKALEYDIEDNLAEPTDSVIEDYPFLTFETQRRAARIIRQNLLDEADIDLEELDEEEREETIQTFTAEAKKELAHGGYNVHLTIKKDVYDAMQEAIANSQWFGPDRSGEDGKQQEEVGAMLIDNNTGAILSFVGGRDFDRQNLNHATQAYRQNGSTMKPLLAYGPAMEQGIVQPGTILPDVPSTYSDGRPYTNYGGSYQGFASVREALKESRNVPAVRTFQRVDHQVSRKVLENLGFTRLEPNEPYESGAIGGLTHGTTVEQNTSAFTVFGNQGKHRETYMIEKIETKDGEVVYQHEPNVKKVFSPQTAFLTVDILRDVLKPGGTAGSLPSRLNFGGDWAGKTGTTNDTHDSWFVGLNPNVTFGIWIGYDKPQTVENYYKGLSYGARTQQIWADMMNAGYQANPDVFGIDDHFEQPEGIVRQTICGISGKLPSSLCSEAGLTTTDYFNADFLPGEVDDSLQESPFVTINGARYKAYDSTPAEFIETGVAIKEDYLDVDEIGKYLPNQWDTVIPDREAPDNGRKPSQVTGVSLDQGTLTWDRHPDNDIVGYIIYERDGTRVGSAQGNTTTTASVSPGGSYFVTAVDSRGRESTASTSVGNSNNNSTDSDENSDSTTEDSNKDQSTENKENNENSSGNEDNSNEGEEQSSDDEKENNEDQGNNNGNENGDNSNNGNESNDGQEDKDEEQNNNGNGNRDGNENNDN